MMLLAWLVSCLVLAAAGSSGIVNTNVLRSMDLSSHILRETTTVLFTNKDETAPITTYQVIVQCAERNLAFLSVQDRDSKKELQFVKDTASSDSLNQVFNVALQTPVKLNEKAGIVVKAVIRNAVEPYPRQVEMFGRNSMRFSGNPWFVSPYSSEKTKTVMTLSGDVDKQFQHADAKVEGKTITFGPINTVEKLKKDFVQFKYQYGKPAMVVTNYKKHIEVSHWGSSLKVQEDYDLSNKIASLKEPFSRIEMYKMARFMPENLAIASIVFELPATASSITYKDEVGNVSTSKVVEQHNRIQLQVRPRFPVYGGWRYKWFHGYTLPLTDFLRTDIEKKYILRVPFWDKIDDMSIDSATIEIALPEGATNPKVYLPFGVDSIQLDKFYTYFDSVGRTMVVIHKNNVVAEHAQEIQISYEYGAQEYLRKPLILSLAFLLVFVTFIVLNRLDTSITKDPKADAILLLKKHRSKIPKINDDINAVFRQLQSEFESFKSQSPLTRDAEAWKMTTRRLESQLNNFEKDLEAVVVKIQKISNGQNLQVTSLTQKLQELSTLYKERRERVKNAQTDALNVQTALAKKEGSDAEMEKKRVAVSAALEKMKEQIGKDEARSEELVDSILGAL